PPACEHLVGRLVEGPFGPQHVERKAEREHRDGALGGSVEGHRERAVALTREPCGEGGAHLSGDGLPCGAHGGIVEQVEDAHEVRLERQGRAEQGAQEVAEGVVGRDGSGGDRKSTRLNSSHVKISYAVFCLKKKKKIIA